MTETVIMDEAGKIPLSPEMMRVFGVKPGDLVQLEVTPGCIIITKPGPEAAKSER